MLDGRGGDADVGGSWPGSMFQADTREDPRVRCSAGTDQSCAAGRLERLIVDHGTDARLKHA
jgi:hypothetical protein